MALDVKRQISRVLDFRFNWLRVLRIECDCFFFIGGMLSLVFLLLLGHGGACVLMIWQKMTIFLMAICFLFKGSIRLYNLEDLEEELIYGE